MTQPARINRLTARVLAADTCGAGLIDRLYALYAQYYTPTDRLVFGADFDAKSWVIVLSDADGRDVGFSTIADRVDVIAGQRVRSLFSGDTIIERAYWGELTLPYAWISLAGQIKAEDPATPLYWLLISKGHRTYRLMPGFTFAYYPQPDTSVPTDVRAIMDGLGRARFGDAYSDGIIRAGSLPTRLRPDLADEDPGSANRHVRFFAQANPGAAQGDELLCLCELSAQNLRPRARTHFLKGMALAG